MSRQGPDDVLIPAPRDDQLSGGLWADAFVFVADGLPGTVTVTDVEPWGSLVFEGFGLDAGQILGAMSQQGDDVVVSLSGETLLMPGAQLDTHDADMVEVA